MTHLVTGAGSGIGALLARRLLERGEDVFVTARTPERAHDLREALPGAEALVAAFVQGPRQRRPDPGAGARDQVDAVVHRVKTILPNC